MKIYYWEINTKKGKSGRSMEEKEEQKAENKPGRENKLSKRR